MVLNCYLSVIRMVNCLTSDMHYYNILANPVATSQFSYDVPAILYLLCITERILYLIDDITIILHFTDTRL